MARLRSGASVSAWLLAPASLLLIAGIAVPLCATIWLSLSPNVLVHFDGKGLGNFQYLFKSKYYYGVIIRSLRIAAEATVIALIVAYPVALTLRRMASRRASAVGLAMMLPVLSGPLVVVLGWMILLSDGGPLLAPLTPYIGRLRIVGSETGIIVGIVHFILPFTVISLASVLRLIPENLVEAARSLGATPLEIFRRVLLPLSLPGLLSAAIIGFSLAASSFIAPHYLGGPADVTLTALVAQFVLATFNGEMAAAVAVLLLVLMAAIIFLLSIAAARSVRT